MSDLVKIMKRVIRDCKKCDYFFDSGNFSSPHLMICGITGENLTKRYGSIPESCPLENAVEKEEN